VLLKFLYALLQTYIVFSPILNNHLRLWVVFVMDFIDAVYNVRCIYISPTNLAVALMVMRF
jgi:hypothetical protein